MANTKKPELLDLAAAPRGPDAPNVEVSDVENVVELLPPDGSEIGFLGPTGHTGVRDTPGSGRDI